MLHQHKGLQWWLEMPGQWAFDMIWILLFCWMMLMLTLPEGKRHERKMENSWFWCWSQVYRWKGRGEKMCWYPPLIDCTPPKNSNFVPRMPFFSFEDNFSTRGLCPRVETVSEKENQGVQGTNITFSTKENSYWDKCIKHFLPRYEKPVFHTRGGKKKIEQPFPTFKVLLVVVWRVDCDLNIFLLSLLYLNWPEFFSRIHSDFFPPLGTEIVGHSFKGFVVIYDRLQVHQWSNKESFPT